MWRRRYRYPLGDGMDADIAPRARATLRRRYQPRMVIGDNGALVGWYCVPRSHIFACFAFEAIVIEGAVLLPSGVAMARCRAVAGLRAIDYERRGSGVIAVALETARRIGWRDRLRWFRPDTGGVVSGMSSAQ